MFEKFPKPNTKVLLPVTSVVALLFGPPIMSDLKDTATGLISKAPETVDKPRSLCSSILRNPQETGINPTNGEIDANLFSKEFFDELARDDRNPKNLWPIKPFDKPHVIRATFGEPRTIAVPRSFMTADTSIKQKLLDNTKQTSSRSSTSWTRYPHNGIDITAKPGTLVYSIQNGIADIDDIRHTIRVGNFEYVHIKPLIKDDTKVSAQRTVIGSVLPVEEHLHLTQFDDSGNPINPLTTGGGLIGYSDIKRPILKDILLVNQDGTNFQAKSGRYANTKEATRSKVEIFVRAIDQPSIQSAYYGKGAIMPTGIYAIAYSIKDNTKDIILDKRVSWRFDTLPSKKRFNMVYHPTSTRCRMPMAKARTDVTNFMYRLNTENPLNLIPTHRYTVNVSAIDASGNIRSQKYTIPRHIQSK